MHPTTFLTTLIFLFTLNPLTTAKTVQGTKIEKVGTAEFIVCPPDAAPKDIVCSPSRRQFGVCPAGGYKLALALPLKEGDWKCGDPNWVSYSTEVVMSTSKLGISATTVVVTPTVTATPKLAA